jgi:hypothetical protein
MTDRAQFEAMLNALINEDQDAAKEIFHNIVVAKSREIYEELLAEDFESGDTGNPYAKKSEEEEEEEGTDEEGTGSEEEEGAAEEDEEGEGEEEEGGADGEENPFGGEEEGEGEEGEGEGDIEDRVLDLEDALEDLKAEFEHLLAGEEHEEQTGIAGDHGGELDGIMGGGDEEDMKGLMEYTLNVPKPTHGDNGQNTKSIVASKNDMGGTTANIAKSFSTTTGGTQGGLLNPATKEENFGNINVPGGKAGKTGFKKQEPGHGAEKKGKGETADKSAGSLLNGVKSRAK